MIELFIELTDQLFWEGYAEQLAAQSPATFQQELNGFMDSYNPNDRQKQETKTTNQKTAKP